MEYFIHMIGGAVALGTFFFIKDCVENHIWPFAAGAAMVFFGAGIAAVLS